MPPKLTVFLKQIIQHRSALVLIAANLVPLAGVIVGGWTAFEVVFLYWLENVVIGFFNICKLLTLGLVGQVDIGEGPAPRVPKTVSRRAVLSLPAYESAAKAPRAPKTVSQRVLAFAAALGVSAFFMVHYGIFSLVHGVFVVTFLKIFPRAVGGQGGPFDLLAHAIEAATGDLGIPFAVLAASHGFSFLYNFLLRREHTQVTVPELMIAPYARVVVMHLTVLFGGILSLLLPHFMVALLVLLKVALDLKYHLKEREKDAIGRRGK